MSGILDLAARAAWRGLSAVRERNLKLFVNLYPPYLGTGIRVTEMAADFRSIEVCMPLTFYNRNYKGTHFGGSLYAMCDPFFMLMVIKNLGPDYVVWDKAGAIRFMQPGRGTVRARFVLEAGRIDALKQEAERNGSADGNFKVDVTDEHGRIVARVQKVVHVRRKHHPGPESVQPGGRTADP